MRIDINSDLGESYGTFSVGRDRDLIPLVSSVNVACGFHAGDFTVMHETVRLAKNSGVKVGAHPGYMDLHGFGRRVIPMTEREIYDLIIYQVAALDGFLRVENLDMHHVKPHGALYNLAAVDESVATAIATAVKDYSSNVILYALSGSVLAKVGEQLGLRVAHEAFVDRQYNANGTLVSRSLPESQIHDTTIAARRVAKMLTEGRVTAVDGTELELRADTLCIHGDSPNAIDFATNLAASLSELGVEIAPPNITHT